MTAKEAIMHELGDFGQEEPRKQHDNEDALEGRRFATDSTGEIIGFDFLSKEIDDEVDGDSDDEKIDESDPYGLANLTHEELDACIQAADETMNTTKLSPEMFDWGLDLVRKAYEEKDARLRAKMKAIDRQAWRARWAREAEEEEEREMAKMEQGLNL